MMFGPDTALMFDAMQMVAITVGVTGAAVFFVMRRRSRANASLPAHQTGKSNLEERVEVLERIATDQSIGLADEIEALRENDTQPTKQTEGQSQ